MTNQEVKRKLAAILSADVKRFSRLRSNQDEMWRKNEAEMNRKKTWFLLGMVWILVSGQGLWQSVLAHTQEPILRLEVGAHNAGVSGITLDPSNHILCDRFRGQDDAGLEHLGPRGTPARSSAHHRRGRGGAYLRRGPVPGRKDCGVWGANRLA